MKTTITRPVIKRCPFRDETDAGTLTIIIPGEAPELHDLAGKVDALCAEEITHEEFTQALAAAVPGAEVVTTWHTGPWDVEVQATG
jgi:hypothetical protein